jgi:hypothetical protein
LRVRKHRIANGSEVPVELVDVGGILAAHHLIDAEELATLRLLAGWLRQLQRAFHLSRASPEGLWAAITSGTGSGGWRALNPGGGDRALFRLAELYAHFAALDQLDRLALCLGVAAAGLAGNPRRAPRATRWAANHRQPAEAWPAPDGPLASAAGNGRARTGAGIDKARRRGEIRRAPTRDAQKRLPRKSNRRREGRADHRRAQGRRVTNNLPPRGAIFCPRDHPRHTRHGMACGMAHAGKCPRRAPFSAHVWRRGRDSNPRSPVRGTTVFETAPFDRSGTSPSERGQQLSIAPLERQENNPVIGTGAL